MTKTSGKSGHHSVFAANLRHLCSMQTSIADVCRDTGINRQQFNKYLAGRAIPSARVLRKICERLGVSEDQLLSSSPGSRPGNGAHTPMIAPPRLPQLGRELDRLFNLFLPDLRVSRSLTQDFGPGAYHVYFPFSGSKGHVLRSYQEVWLHNDLLMFTRLTRLKEPGKPLMMAIGRHFGVAIAARGEVSLMARNRASPFQVSMINIRPTLVLTRYFVGLTMTHGAGLPVTSRVVLERLDPAGSRREHLKACGVMASDDPRVPTFVQKVLQADGERDFMLHLPNVEEIVGAWLGR